MKTVSLVGMMVSLLILARSQTAHASGLGPVLSCNGGYASFEIEKVESGGLILHLHRDGVSSGLVKFAINQAGTDFHSDPSTHETVYQVDVTRKANGGYFLVLADGFGGAYDFAAGECQRPQP